MKIRMKIIFAYLSCCVHRVGDAVINGGIVGAFEVLCVGRDSLTPIKNIPPPPCHCQVENWLLK
jgi:hypothetical protein